MMARIGVWSIRAAATTVLGLAVPVAAQVIEIGSDGQTDRKSVV